MPNLFFATDIHGSDICWKKFINSGKFYGAEVIILGGDISGKALVPLLDLGNGKYRATLLQQEFTLHDEIDVDEMEKKIRSRGYYPYRTSTEEIQELQQHPEKLNELFKAQVLRRMQEWIAYAEDKLAGASVQCYVTMGNDDPFELDDLIRAGSKNLQVADNLAIEILPGIEMVSSGWSNRTPWHTQREEDEADLEKRYEGLFSQVKDPHACVVNFHVPPFNSGLDEAPELTEDLRPKHAGNALIPVGSKAGRKMIEKYQPLLGLFGHIHESKGVTRIGKTVCINPGSMYEQACLLGSLVTIENKKVKNHVMTTG